jgi:uncharacterized protein (TIGR02569 family)
MSRLAPPPHVLAAFGAVGVPQPLAGGTGSSWRAGSLVLKPLDCAEREIPWQAEIFATIEQDGFRFAAPLPDVVDGWIAAPFLEGRHEHGRWRDIIAVGGRFHAALADVPRPDAIIDARTNPWEIGDRVAWGIRPYNGIDDLLAALEPVDEGSQLMHGDLTGNVLFHDELPPAIIDFAPYWHPTEYATAIIATDAVLWEDAPEDLLDAAHPQYLLRALIYRGVTSLEFGTDDWRSTFELARRIARCASR